MDQNLYLVQAILYSGKSFTVWKFQDFAVTQILREIILIMPYDTNTGINDCIFEQKVQKDFSFK